MKKILFSFTGFFTMVSLHSQNPPDTAWGSWPEQEYYNSILSAPVVSGGQEPVAITPNGQKLCFDKKVMIKSFISTGPVEQCMYLNTKEGYSALLPPGRGAASCDMKTDDPKFFMFVFGLKGNAYTFRNVKKASGIEHWVSSGNTQAHTLNMATMTGVYTLEKKTERRGYNGDKIKTWAYKYDDPGSPVYFLFGKNYPDQVEVSSLKYIGNYGVGYQFTDKGLYIIMEMEGSGFGCKIESIEETSVCFDPSPYKIMEDEFYAKAFQGIEREKQKIEADAARVSGECSPEKMELIQFRREQVRIQEQRLYTSQQGNVYDDKPVQQAMSQMVDHVAMAQQTILDLKVKICNARERMSKTRSEQEKSRLSDRISCYNGQIAQMQSLKGQLEALDRQYADSPGQAYAEKSKLFFRNMQGGCN